MKNGLKLRQRWGQGKLIPNHQQRPQYAKRPVLKVKKKIVSHFIGVSRASFILARGASIKPVAFGQWESRNYFSFFSRPFLDILWWLLLVFSWGIHRARAYHSTFESARYRKQLYLIWRRAAIFVQVLILLCEVTFGLSYIKFGLTNSIYTVKS